MEGTIPPAELLAGLKEWRDQTDRTIVVVEALQAEVERLRAALVRERGNHYEAHAVLGEGETGFTVARAELIAEGLLPPD